MKNIELAIEKSMLPIEVSTAKEMVARYQATRKTLIDETHGINDTRSIWFDIEGLKNFINNLPENASGVRVHLAAYDQGNKHAPNQTTVIFTGTIEKGYGHVDVLDKDDSLWTIEDDVMGPFNAGRTCPPLCG
ncbi:MAG: hypothetical protein JWQ34_1667 [Mucilaginibacter sp.]|uniref:hypothetical protein n=1 Tax=Mucilaginibacter sp. TaxID=1882438 RepID=UPI0026098D9C|nr:hypothetical protein [Mucilaginibacter sp.]MDB5003442.1 hypothetical protein [Mucilaginibacter sp.]